MFGVGGLMGGGLTASATATSGATGGVLDTSQNIDHAFNFKSDARTGSDSTVMVAGLAAVALVIVAIALRK